MTRISKTGIWNDPQKDCLSNEAGHDRISLNSNTNRGFTLLELLAVIAIIGLALALSLPKFSFNSNTKLNSQAKNIAGLIRYLNDAAATRKVYYKMWFNIEKGILRIELSRDGKAYEDAGEPHLRTVKTKGGVEIEDVVLPGVGKVTRGELAIVFTPLGVSDPFDIHMKASARTLTLSFNPYTGKVKITDGYV